MTASEFTTVRRTIQKRLTPIPINNVGESLLGLVVAGVGGLIFCLSLWYTQSLWCAIGFHAGCLR
ncbi:CPBP family glutamic-type intramembrane protease [Occallatibacter riparius]|uniref:CPBP family glutamic-type intramembrane protease n=1 Tax=Occallatibacter riparius TaxID=1002689 RepID=UPI0036F1C3DF